MTPSELTLRGLLRIVGGGLLLAADSVRSYPATRADRMTATRDLSFDTLQLEQDGRVLTVRYSNPPLNFMTTGFIRELDRLTSSVDHDPTVGAVVLTGGVEGRFLTHLDARELGGIQDLPHPQVPMQAVEFVVPVLNLVLRLPGLVSRSSGSAEIPARGSSWAIAGSGSSCA